MTYTVRCKSCNPRKERDVQAGPDEEMPMCKCGKRTTKVMVPFSVSYKGEGWTGAQKDYDSQ